MPRPMHGDKPSKGKARTLIEQIVVRALGDVVGEEFHEVLQHFREHPQPIATLHD